MNKQVFACLVAVLGHAAYAQTPSGAGGILLQIPQPPPSTRPAPEIRIEPQQPSAPAATAADSTRVVVKALRVTGATVYSEAELIALTGFVPNTEMSLADLQVLAARITAHYRLNGYFVAQAMLPAQDVRDNVVTIAVSEGRYGKVQVRNQSRLSDAVAQRALRGLNPGDLITVGDVETRLLMLSDLPGVDVRSTLEPGATAGTSDLIIDIAPAPLLSGSVDVDNGGSRYTGEVRGGVTLNINDPLGMGDLLSLRALTSGSGLRYGRVSWQVPFGRAQFGVAYSALDYELGREFAPLRANGTAQIASVFGRYAVIRSRKDNVYVQLALDSKAFHDRLDSIPAVTDRRSNVLTASVFGDHRDNFGGGGTNSYTVNLSAGDLDIRTPAARAADALTARTQGGFGKLSFSAMRLQSLGGPFSLYAGANGQLASKNLDVSEKMELGGMNAVRAYPEGEAYADQGVVLTLEARMELPRATRLPGNMQLVAFVDTGAVTLNHSPWAPGDNHRHLSGAGVGFNWGDPGNFLLRASYAFKLGNQPALSAPDRSGQFWLQFVKYF